MKDIKQNLIGGKNQFWYIIGGVILLGGISFFVYRGIKRKNALKKQEEEDKLKEEEVKKLEENAQGTESEDTEVGDTIFPKRNVDKAINNKFSDLRGVLILPAKKSNNPVEGHPFASGFVNVRENAEVNNPRGFFKDLNIDNVLGKVSAGSPIGTIASEKYDNQDPAMRWFMVKLSKPIKGWKYGWVRADAVTFKPFSKKSKFSGFAGDDIVVRYNNSFQLGGTVFPHTSPPY